MRVGIAILMLLTAMVSTGEKCCHRGSGRIDNCIKSTNNNEYDAHSFFF